MSHIPSSNNDRALSHGQSGKPLAPGPRGNRLALEASPYLLQHQHNPVDWHPWGEAAFAKARAERKPIFLSIGYSTCHWCHVMERESFTDERVAWFLNRHFISIKVDREERPDVDRVYMTFVQNSTGEGGWPLSAFLTPELRPFLGGTYFPPEARHGGPAFLTVLRQVQRAWQEQSGEMQHSAARLQQQLARRACLGATPAEMPGPACLARAVTACKAEYDLEHGGFGAAPKFPRPAEPMFLLQQAVRARDGDGVRMVLHTCDRMAAGGIHDHLGGGFARYSVDAAWAVPHFEKMLYDNAQLIHLYLDAFLVSGESRHAAVVRDIAGYVQRDLTHPDGGFYSAEDADSEGQEGRFYCWTRLELAAGLDPGEFGVACRYFGINDQGNFRDHSHPQPHAGLNVLRIADHRLSAEESALLARAKEKMRAARTQRVRPLRDDKVLASWNGLMLGALARAGAVLDEPGYRLAAERNLRFLQANLWDAPTRTLHHRWRNGQRDQAQLLGSYACVVAGALQLYETTLDPAELAFAVSVAESMLTRFADAAQGGFWQSPANASDLILQLKEDYDGAEPSGNSVATLALLKLAAITGRAEFQTAAEQCLRLFHARLKHTPPAVPYLLSALDYCLAPLRRVVVAGDPADPARAALVRSAHQVYQPNKVVLGTTGAVAEFFRTVKPLDGRATAFVCIGSTCHSPTREPSRLQALLRASESSSSAEVPA
jgi:uncharacterized protein YyaL (SSP411 family)